jgi:hypothetical protein
MCSDFVLHFFLSIMNSPSHQSHLLFVLPILALQSRYFDWYDEHIRMPFVEDIRIKRFGMREGGIVTRSLESVLSHDGGTEQLTANVRESRLAQHADRRNICTKTAANDTAVQQDLDKVKTGFKALKSNIRTLSRKTVRCNVASASIEEGLRLAKKNAWAESHGFGILNNG